MTRITSAIAAAALTLTALPGAAQEPVVRSHVEPDSVMIGDRFDYIIDVEKDLVQVVEFPSFTGSPEGDFELVEEFPVDTLLRDGRHLKLRKRYRMAAFEEGNFNLGAAAVLYADKNILDTLRGRDSVYLRVNTFRSRSTTSSRRRPCRSAWPRSAGISGGARSCSSSSS